MSDVDLDQMLRIGIIAKDYYNQIEIKPSKQDFQRWIESLKEPMKSSFQKKSMEECIGVLNFRRFILESRDYGMDEYMKEHLSAEDFEFWKTEK